MCGEHPSVWQRIEVGRQKEEEEESILRSGQERALNGFHMRCCLTHPGHLVERQSDKQRCARNSRHPDHVLPPQTETHEMPHGRRMHPQGPSLR